MKTVPSLTHLAIAAATPDQLKGIKRIVVQIILEAIANEKLWVYSRNRFLNYKAVHFSHGGKSHVCLLNRTCPCYLIEYRKTVGDNWDTLDVNIEGQGSVMKYPTYVLRAFLRGDTVSTFFCGCRSSLRDPQYFLDYINENAIEIAPQAFRVGFVVVPCNIIISRSKAALYL
jgi:hypothetical protein